MFDPAAVSSVLLGHAQVGQAVTTTARHEGRQVGVALVELHSYVCGPELRDYVWEQLGAGCGLDAVLPLDAVPTAAEATDQVRAALSTGSCAVFEAPRGELEERLVAIWGRAMDRRWVSVHDDFFELGGDSMTAIELLGSIEDELGESMDVFEFMTASSVRGLADALRSRVSTG